MTEDVGVWLYAVTRGVPQEKLTGLTGVAGEPLRTLEAAGLTAVVGSVSLGEFGEQPLRRNLEDLDWLDATARAHDAVVTAVVRCAPTIPLRLATVYLDDARICGLLTERRADFEAALRRVSGRTEWGVKAYGDPATLTASATETQNATGGAGAGTAYLLRRRAELSAQEAVERRAAAHAEEIHAELLRHATAGRCHPATDPVLTGKRAWMVLNGTYLVDDDRVAEFAATVAALEDKLTGIHLELSGPWPPYSFASIEQEDT